jgi:hypothetical protein
LSGKGANKSSMQRCQMSPVDGEFIGAAINVFFHERFESCKDIG